MRYFIQLSYHGGNFHGWQIQPNATSVQEHLNKALSAMTGQEVYCVGAGRTDTGVHAREMWAHFDVNEALHENFAHKLNKFVGPDIAIGSIVPVKEDAHARFSATSRSYEYVISRKKDPFLNGLAYYFYGDLDLTTMNEGAEVLKKFEDFSSFARSNTQTKTNLCKIEEAKWIDEGDRLVFRISADRFLRNMVRSIVGTLMELGLGKRDLKDLEDLIEAKDRRKAGESAPAHGLYLTDVEYPKDIFDVG